MLVSIIIPIFNEENSLFDFLKVVDSFNFEKCEKELIFIDDCSTDQSLKILNQYKFKSNTTIKRQLVNSGKGSALQVGFTLAQGEIITIQDADFEYQIEDLNKLIKPIIDNRADVVYGSRLLNSKNQFNNQLHYQANSILTFLSNQFCKLKVSDMETCYKIFRADIIKNIRLESKRFGFEPEVTAKLAKLHIRFKEYPISYNPRTYLEGKKISWKDGLAAIWHILFFNLYTSSNEQFFFKELPSNYIKKMK